MKTYKLRCKRGQFYNLSGG